MQKIKKIIVIIKYQTERIILKTAFHIKVYSSSIDLNAALFFLKWRLNTITFKISIVLIAISPASNQFIICFLFVLYPVPKILYTINHYKKSLGIQAGGGAGESGILGWWQGYSWKARTDCQQWDVYVFDFEYFFPAKICIQ